MIVPVKYNGCFVAYDKAVYNLYYKTFIAKTSNIKESIITKLDVTYYPFNFKTPHLASFTIKFAQCIKILKI